MPLRNRLRFEVGASGVDEALQGLTSDPYGAPVASGPGLRVPAFVPTNPVASNNRMLFLLATRQVQRRCVIRGLSQTVTIGTNTPVVSGGDRTTQIIERPMELNVTTPTFRFPDGNISWHLVLEPNIRNVITRPLTDAPNFCFQEADGPALLYSTMAYANGNVNPVTGAPANYPVGMTAYTPPTITSRWSPLGGLGCFYDLRFRSLDSSMWNKSVYIEVPAESNCRVSFYASVLQTAGNAFSNTTYPVCPSMSPEENFIASGWTNGVFYWRVGGRMVFEDEVGIDCASPEIWDAQVDSKIRKDVAQRLPQRTRSQS